MREFISYGIRFVLNVVSPVGEFSGGRTLSFLYSIEEFFSILLKEFVVEVFRKSNQVQKAILLQ